MTVFKRNVHLGTKDPLIETDDIADKAVTTEKIDDGAVTSEKIAKGGVGWENVSDDVRNIIASMEKGGVALSGKFGDSELIGINQKKLTEEIGPEGVITQKVATLEEAVGEGGSVDERIAIETNRAQAAEELLREAYESLSQSQPIPKTAEEWAAMTSWEEGVIYRVAGTTSYTDYMYNGTTTIPMATYNNAIDDEPTAGSNNLVKSGGVALQISQLGQGVNDISDILNGSEEEIKTPQTPLSTSGYINCSAAEIGQAYNRTVVASYEGAACWRIPVSVGEKYEILAKGNGNAGALYVLTGNNDIVLAKVGNSESKTTPVILNITQNGFLYVNDMEYSIIPGNVYKVTTQYNDGLIERVEELEESEVVDNLTTADATKALSANQGKIIGDILNGTESTQNTPISLDENAYYNTADGRVNIGAQLSSDGYASKLVEVTPGEQYIICGASSSNAIRLYCFADADKVFTYRQQSPIDTRQNPLTITIPDGVAYMVCNFTNYNNQTDGLLRIDTIVTEGLIDKVEDLEKLPWYGKTIVLFGDSIAEGQRYFDTKKRFSDWIEKYTGATVINIAVGGAKIRQHVPPVLNPASQAEAYHATQIYNMVWACVNNDFSYQDAAGEYLPYYVGDGKAFTLMQTIDWANVSAVIIHGGGNDWYNSPKVGEPGSTDITTTCGAINEINRLLSTTYPHVSIYWIAPSIRKIRIERENEPGVYDYYYCDNNFSRVGNTLPQFIEKMMESAEIQNTPCLDMYHTMGWNQYNQIYYYPNSADGDAHFDGTHPHNGYKEMARHIVGFLTANRSFD